MALYVVPVPDPPAGTDWIATVPGQYLWDVIGITGRVTTAGTTLQNPMTDRSGWGQDGTYGDANLNGLSLVPGLVSGDAALRVSLNNGAGHATLTEDVTAGDFTIGFWCEADRPHAFVQGLSFTGPAGVTADFYLRGDDPFNFCVMEYYPDAIHGTAFRAGTATLPTGPVFAVAVYTAATNGVDFYVNGTHYQDVQGSGFPMTKVCDTIHIGATAITDVNIYDEVIGYSYALDASQVADLYAAGLTDYASWSDQVDASGLELWYSLDDGGPAFSVHPDLVVTDGTNTVADVPAGFATTYPGAGPYSYSWQPGLNSSTQGASGDATTVAIPQLILPAGYTIGTRTSDLGALDQWSDVVIWWDDSRQQQQQGLSDYEYAPGVTYVIQR